MEQLEKMYGALRSFFGAILVVAMITGLAGCGGSPDSTATENVTAEDEAPSDASPAAEDLLKSGDEIDIGDVSYGVYALIRYAYEDFPPRNIEVTKLSSPRFDNRIQMLTLDIAPEYPKELDFVLWLGSTRPLNNHSVDVTVHVYRQYVPAGSADGEEIVEEIFSVQENLGDAVGVLTPFQYSFDPLSGMESIPETMLLYTELDASLYLYTSISSFDPENPGKEPTDSVRYNGFNPARINFLGGAQE